MNIVSASKYANSSSVQHSLSSCILSMSFPNVYKHTHTHTHTHTHYSGYWHGSVAVHQRQSTKQTELNFYIREAHTLSKIRHENVQLFLGVCLDLRPDSVALVMRYVQP